MIESVRFILCTLKIFVYCGRNTQHVTALCDLGYLLNSSVLQQMVYLVTTEL